MYLKYCCLLLSVILAFSFESNAQDKQNFAFPLHVADSLFAVKQYKKAASVYATVRKLNYGVLDTVHLYKAAACWTATGKSDSAFLYLEFIAYHGFENEERLSTDPLFTRLHRDGQWETILSAVHQNRVKLIPSVALELSQMLKNYRDGFEQYQQLVEQHGKNSKEAKAFKYRLREVDSTNFIKVSSIVNTYGWRGREYFGPDGPEALITTLLHANIVNQKKYFSIVRIAALNGSLPAEGFAIMADNIALYENNTQIYGTHLRLNNGQYEAYAIADEPGVDTRRNQIGLCTLAVYLQNFKPYNQLYYFIK
ncbi:hypothetical protein SAMN05192574_102834 [Mucilaginibacter gossypiicola]|uniref:Uncharacterized protein n=1 Tax=Mucilaginibacter gossypiicola TaxID=551995 RepID=A0A1H8ET66_9SPHI|nr:DUF6624 domain-containing protein [Mucilaginibacter gossypiicola]SEN22665.1 hypothetical protein SAMN05192574_102834 [Mucilaginibacter gossypiicola]